MNTPNLLFVDGSAGAAGDMLLAAGIELGVPAAKLRRALAGLPVAPWRLTSRPLSRLGLKGRDVRIRANPSTHHHTWKEIRSLVRRGKLAPVVRDQSLAVFERLFSAEAKVHGRTVDTVHLHEAGSVDAIVDIVGFCWILDALSHPRVHTSTLTTGSGIVRCAHGNYPVPAPATLELCRGLPIQAGPLEVERLTPTGAAILATLTEEWGPAPPMRPHSVGYGAGDRSLPEHPNMLRLVLGEALSAPSAQPSPEVTVMECEIDDADPQLLADVTRRLLAAGALDANLSAVTMKKGRLGTRLSVICRADRRDSLLDQLLIETPTLGVRWRTERRIELDREQVRVRTPFGTISMKVAHAPDGSTRAWPEFEDCRRAADRHDCPLREVREAAQAAWRAKEAGRRGRR